MEKIMNEPGPCDAEQITSDEVLKRVPTSEHMQDEMRHIAAFTQEFRESVRAVDILDIIGRHLAGLPDSIEGLMRVAVGTVFKIGNFSNAGGRIVFVDPPEKQEKTNGEG